MIAIAVDDEPLALSIIKTFCSKIDFIELRHAFTEASDALNYLNTNHVDLLFLDINMPSISGIEFYKKAPKNVMVIFTTAFSEYAVEGFNLNAVDYLLKPFSFDRFIASAEKAKEYYNYLHKNEKTATEYIFLRIDYSMVKIALADITYIEGLDNYIKIHLSTGKNLLVRMSMKSIADKLPEGKFIRVHRSYIVPLSKVISVRNKIIYLDKTEIPVGTNYVDEVLKLFGE